MKKTETIFSEIEKKITETKIKFIRISPSPEKRARADLRCFPEQLLRLKISIKRAQETGSILFSRLHSNGPLCFKTALNLYHGIELNFLLFAFLPRRLGLLISASLLATNQRWRECRFLIKNSNTHHKTPILNIGMSIFDDFPADKVPLKRYVSNII